MSAVDRLRATVRRLLGRAEASPADWPALADLDAAARLLETMRFAGHLSPARVDPPGGQRLLVIAPHPDDEAIGPGGTLHLARRAGASVTVLHVTSGTASDRDAREAEARANAAAEGFEAAFLGQPQRSFAAAAAGAAIAGAAGAQAFDAVFVPFVLDDNADHRRANAALIEAARLAPTLAAATVWAYQVYTPLPGNALVDITDAAAAKRAAIARYASQMRRRDWAHFALGLNAFNCRLMKGEPRARFVESFVVLSFPAYRDLVSRYLAEARP
jgi:N-acetylglucosamine malate deacetylase 1